MNIAVLHLSDLHCKINSKLKPADKVAACFREAHENIERLFIVVTGDLTYSGSKKQYDFVIDYFNNLQKEILGVTGTTPIFVCIPGNHDCEHPKDTELRDVVLDKIKTSKGNISSPSIINQSISVQNNFFSYISAIDQYVPKKGEIIWQNKIDDRILFLCHNSAWMSTKDEKQGELYIPESTLLSPDHEEIVISIIHHPYNWFEAENGRKLRNHLESISDIILTGHEHEMNWYSKTTSEGVIEYIEGGIFNNENHQNNSNFSIIYIDTQQKVYKATQYKWTTEGFRIDGKSVNHKFIRASRGSSKFSISDDFDNNFLKDMGIHLTHRAKTIEFEDLYTLPDLRKYEKLDTEDKLLKKVIHYDKVINTVFSDKYVYFGGDSQSGKTSLAKYLYRSSLKRGIFPVYIEGNDINNINEGSIHNLICNSYKKQYSHPDFEIFSQLPLENKCIIIDDFSESPLNREYKGKFLNILREQYGYTFVFGGDFSHIEEMIADLEEGRMISFYSHYEIMELGHVVRNKLIEKWITLGVEHLTEKASLSQQIEKAEEHINTILGKNLLPAYPIFILSMLQQIEAGTPVETKSGSYGYFYEVFITASLQKSSNSIDDIDGKYTYLSEFAWHLHLINMRYCSLEDMLRFNEIHCTNYGLPPYNQNFTQELINSQILVTHNGNIGFRHKYHYYYFLARYIRDNLSDITVTRYIDECVAELYKEECANVIIFVTYLCKNKSIIDKLLSAAKDIYKDISPCDLDTHVSFLDKLYNRIPQISLPYSDPVSLKKQKLSEKDSTHLQTRTTTETSGMSKESDDEDLTQFLTINKAIKTIQILGQILRNYSGSFKRQEKYELTMECFGVGLRTLNAYYNLIEKHLESIIETFSHILGKKLSGKNPDKQIEVAKEIIFILTEVLCYEMIHRLSMAVGSEKLIPIYDDVQDTMGCLAVDFVQVSIRMDHMQPFPERHVFELYEKLENKVFGITLLRILVANHFYMFEEPRESRHRVCQKLEIAQTKKMLPGFQDKKFKK
jgi:predicted MPP superfamily phosphohydrolase